MGAEDGGSTLVKELGRKVATRIGNEVRNSSAFQDLKRWRNKQRQSFSQYGEDLELDRLLEGKADGVYVDVGAFDPELFSNTKRFYLRGWSGINVEPSRERYQRFLAERPRDVNLNCGVSDRDGTLPFFMLEPDSLSTFDEAEKDHALADGFSLVNTVEVPVRTLSGILEEHLGDRTIDLMSIDVEGVEDAVLSSNDWERFRPRFLVLEVNRDPALAGRAEDFGYKQVLFNGTNAIFESTERSGGGSGS